MVDVVSPETRSRMMSGIRGKDTIPELIVRKALHSMGFRYRLHAKELPGKPDIVLPKYSAVVFVHGCFWHGHSCPLFKMPSTRPEFWRDKISRNCSNDARAFAALRADGWRVAVIWECALKGKNEKGVADVAGRVAGWLHGTDAAIEVSG